VRRTVVCVIVMVVKRWLDVVLFDGG